VNPESMAVTPVKQHIPATSSAPSAAGVIDPG
jgi:hypothetical protein